MNDKDPPTPSKNQITPGRADVDAQGDVDSPVSETQKPSTNNSKKNRKRSRSKQNRQTQQDDPFANVTRSQLRDALGEDSDVKVRDMMRAIKQAQTPEEALAAMAEQAVEQGERLAMTRIVPPTIQRARLKLRHIITVLSFFLFVVAPTGFAAWYLMERAAPQYASTTAFSVRREDHSTPTDLLGGAFGLASNSTNDADILYDFLTSQGIVSSIRDYRDLAAIWSRPGTDFEEGDPIFAMWPGGTIEDQMWYWNRMVRVAYDTSANILEVRVLAFDPDDAKVLAQDLLNESTKMINSLSSLAQRDVLEFAETDLRLAENELRAAREAVTTFRNTYQIASIDTDIALSTGPLNALTQQLAEAKIDRGLLVRGTSEGDPRLVHINARIQVIEEQILEERAKLGATSGGDGTSVLSSRIAEFEQLNVDLQFAQNTYETALSSFYSARADATRQSLYLAAHENPTLAERADFPNSFKIMGLVFGLSLAVWGIIALSLLSLRDRR